MFVLYANKNKLTVRKREPITSGSVNVYWARFEFSDDWDGLTQKAVFRGSGQTISVLLDENGECTIPWETLTKSGGKLETGVYGTLDETTLPTIWADLGPIFQGVAPGEGTHPPTPDLWEQQLAKKGDGLDYDGLYLSLLSGGTVLDTVKIDGGGGGEGGTTDHRALSNRGSDNQHPISAITGLREALDKIPVPMTAEELREILTKAE